jgi:type IV pilus assembly protein PilW
MRTLRRHRGFSLVEITVAMTVSAIVLVAAIAAARSQQRSYYDGQRLREAQGAARNALLFLEEKLPLAGFGMDPALALDFGWYAGPCPTELSSCPRDSKTNADELVFYARNPSYWVPQLSSDDFRGHVWQLVSLEAASDRVTIKAREGDTFPRGRILQLVCEGGSRWAYVTVAANVPPLAADGDVLVTLEDEGAGENPFRGQSLASDPCFTPSGGVRPRAFQIDRYRFHLRPVDDGSGVPDPFLVLDTGVDVNGDGQVTLDDELILAEGIETIQVAYHFTNATTLGEAGATAGTAITFAAGTAATADQVTNKIVRTNFPGPAPSPTVSSEFVYARSSFFPYTFGPPVAAERDTNHQANIRGVRVRLLTRSAGRDGQRVTQSPLRSGVPVMNLDSSPSWLGAAQGYEWISLETTVALPNMTSRRLLDQ